MVLANGYELGQTEKECLSFWKLYKTCSLHFCRIFQAAKDAVDTLRWTQRNSLPHHQKVIEIVWGLKPILL